jgi:hypothetical protein
MATSGYRMIPFKHPGAQSQPSGSSWLSTFYFSAFPAQLQNLVPHVVRLVYVVNGSIVQAATAGAILDTDWDMLLTNSQGPTLGTVENTGITMQANGKIPVQCSMSSFRNISRSYGLGANFLGLQKTSVSGPSLAASTPGRTVPVTLVYTFDFLTDNLFSQFHFIKPLAWWQNGNIQIQMSDPNVVFGSLFSWAAPPSVSLYSDFLCSPDIIIGNDFEFRERVTIATTTQTTQIQPSRYTALGFFSPKFNGLFGGQDLLPCVTNIYTSDFLERFPNNLGAGEYGILAAGRGASEGPWGYPVSLQNPVQAQIPLVYPRLTGAPYEGASWCELDTGNKQLNFIAQINNPLTTQHQYWLARSIDRVSCGSDNPLGGDLGESVLKSVSDATGCVGKYTKYAPNIPPGHTPPPASQIARTPVIAKRTY